MSYPFSIRESQILAVLAGFQLYGVEIKQRFSSIYGVDLSIGSIYTTLQRMEMKALVSSALDLDNGRTRKRYFITQRGANELGEFLNSIDKAQNSLENSGNTTSTRENKNSQGEYPLDIFLCHSAKDKRFVRRLAHDLATLGFNVWFDEWALELGDSLHECIGKALLESSYVAVILSPDSVESRWCKDELCQALSQEKKRNSKIVIPVLYRRVEPPPFLEDRLYCNFSSSYFVALLQIAGLMVGHSSEDIARVGGPRPKSLEDVYKKLFESDLATKKYVRASDFRKIQTILQNHGIELASDVLQIIGRDDGKLVSHKIVP